MDESKIFELTRQDPVTGELEPVPAKVRVDAIMEHPHAREVIRSMDPQSLYGLIMEAGFEDAYELALLASPSQCQAFIDFDAWTRDVLQPERFERWLEIFLQRDDEEMAEIFAETDPEPLALWMLERMRVLTWEEDEELIHQIDDPIMTSPDGVYALVLPMDEYGEPLEDTATLHLLLARAYDVDVALGQRLIEAVRYELPTDLMEHAFQRRTARLGDLGFVPFHEAEEVFAFLDPVAWASRARATGMDATSPPITFTASTTLPPLDQHVQELELRTSRGERSAFTRGMASLPNVLQPEQLSPTIDALFAQLRALINRVVTSEHRSPGDRTAAQNAVRRVDATLSVALELAARDDHALAASILARVPLKETHRAGYAATTQLARQARAIVERGNLTLVDGDPCSLLREGQRDTIDGLLMRRPVVSASSGELFSSHESLLRVGSTLGEIAFLELLFFGVFRFTRDELIQLVFDEARSATPAEMVTFHVLFATLVVDALSPNPAGLRAIPAVEVRATLADAWRSEDGPMGTLDAAGRALIRARNVTDESVVRMAVRTTAEIAGALVDAIGENPMAVPDEVLHALLMIAPATEAVAP